MALGPIGEIDAYRLLFGRVRLSGIRNAVTTYLKEKVTIEISNAIEPVSGTITKNEPFYCTVTVRNAPESSGGVQLVNVRYVVVVANPGIATVKVPPHGFANELGSGQPLSPGSYAGAFVYNPYAGTEHDKLTPGEMNVLKIDGKATDNQMGGTTQLSVFLRADIDMDYLFPKNQETSAVSTLVEVVG